MAVWHLLTHTPGWEGQLTAEDRAIYPSHNFAESQRELPQLAPPGTIWSYNNAGFTIAGRVIEAVTGQRIHEALRGAGDPSRSVSRGPLHARKTR